MNVTILQDGLGRVVMITSAPLVLEQAKVPRRGERTPIPHEAKEAEIVLIKVEDRPRADGGTPDQEGKEALDPHGKDQVTAAHGDQTDLRVGIAASGPDISTSLYLGT